MGADTAGGGRSTTPAEVVRMGADWPTIGVVVALGALLWRRIAAVGARVDALDGRLTRAIGDVDRRLARLKGWIEGERAGQGGASRRPGGAGALTTPVLPD